MSSMVIRTPADGSAGTGAAGPQAANVVEAAGASVYRVLLAWATVIILLVLLARTRAGYSFIYYSLALMLLILIVTQYRVFSWLLAPFSNGSIFTSNAGITEQAPTHRENTSAASAGNQEKAPLATE